MRIWILVPPLQVSHFIFGIYFYIYQTELRILILQGYREKKVANKSHKLLAFCENTRAYQF